MLCIPALVGQGVHFQLKKDLPQRCACDLSVNSFAPLSQNWLDLLDAFSNWSGLPLQSQQQPRIQNGKDVVDVCDNISEGTRLSAERAGGLAAHMLLFPQRPDGIKSKIAPTSAIILELSAKTLTVACIVPERQGLSSVVVV